MDATKKITGLVQTGGAVIGGQMAATIITDQALNMAGDFAAPGTIGRKAGSVGLPVILGAVVMGFSKNEMVQMAGIGAVTAGVAAASNILLGDSTPAFFPTADGYGADYDDYVALPGADVPALPPASGVMAGDTVQLVEVDQLA